MAFRVWASLYLLSIAPEDSTPLIPEAQPLELVKPQLYEAIKYRLEAGRDQLVCLRAPPL